MYKQKYRNVEDIPKERIEEVLIKINNLYGKGYIKEFYHDIQWCYIKKQFGDEMVKYEFRVTKTSYHTLFRGVHRMVCKRIIE